MKPNSYSALLKINQSDDMNTKKLAEDLEITYPTAMALVNKLVAEGLVEKDTRGHKSNGFRLILTAKGIKVLGDEFAK